MSITYGFYNSINSDRLYNATQMSSLFDGIINDGIFMSVGDALVVSASSGMDVIVGTGRAWFNHTWTNNDSTIPLSISAAEVVLNRIDTVVLEIDSTEEVRANSIKIIKGTPASTPVSPTLLATELIHQYPLAYIYVAPGVTEIIISNITNAVGTSESPFVTGILETMNIDALLLQWGSDFQNWLTANDTEFNIWFQTLVDILDENTAANLLNLINELIVQGTSTIPNTGWVANTGDYILKYSLTIAGVIIGNWVDVTVDKDYQDVAQTAELCSTIEEYEGGITFFANHVPTSSIPIRYKVVK